MERFYFNEEKKALVKITIKEVEYSLKNGEINVRQTNVIEEGQLVSLPAGTKLYSNPDGFERGEITCIRNKTQVMRGIGLHEDRFYTNREGEPIIFDKEKELIIKFNAETGKYDTSEKVYASLEAFFDNEDYVEINEEGEKIVHEARLKKYKMSDEDTEIIEKIKKAIREASSRNIRLVYDDNCGCIFAAKNIRSVTEEECDTQEDVRHTCNRAYENHKIYITDPYWLDCNYILEPIS